MSTMTWMGGASGLARFPARTEQESVIVQTYDTPQAVRIPDDEFRDYRAWRECRQKGAVWLNELRAVAEEVSV